MADTVSVGVWRKLGAGLGWGKVSEIRTWATLSLEPRFNRPGLWSMTMPWNSQTANLSKQNLLTFDVRGTRMTGVIEQYGAASDENGQPVLEVSGTDALTFLSDALGWPTPAKDLDAQTEVRYYRTGPAETVVRGLVAANLVSRLGYEMTLPASLGRGDTVTINSLFDNVLTVATDNATLGNVGIRCGLVQTTSSTRAALTVEFYDLVDRSARVRLSYKVGTLRTWRQTDSVPAATRAVVQAAKEQTGHDVASVNIGGANSFTTKSVKTNKLRTGDIVTFTGGTPPAPIELDVAYIAIRVDQNTFKVAWTRADAQDGVEINLTDAGSGKITVTEQTRRYLEVTTADSETEWGRVREVLVSGSGDDRDSALRQQGRQTLKDQGAQSAFEIDTTEAEGMRYGVHYGVGDTVTVELVTGVSKVAQIGAVRIEVTPDKGLTIQVVPGNPDATNPLFQQAAIIRALRQRVNQAQED